MALGAWLAPLARRARPEPRVARAGREVLECAAIAARLDRRERLGPQERRVVVARGARVEPRVTLAPPARPERPAPWVTLECAETRAPRVPLDRRGRRVPQDPRAARAHE